MSTAKAMINRKGSVWEKKRERIGSKTKIGKERKISLRRKLKKESQNRDSEWDKFIKDSPWDEDGNDLQGETGERVQKKSVIGERVQKLCVTGERVKKKSMVQKKSVTGERAQKESETGERVQKKSVKVVSGLKFLPSVNLMRRVANLRKKKVCSLWQTFIVIIIDHRHHHSLIKMCMCLRFSVCI
jgi:hypothetical protein